MPTPREWTNLTDAQHALYLFRGTYGKLCMAAQRAIHYGAQRNDVLQAATGMAGPAQLFPVRRARRSANEAYQAAQAVGVSAEKLAVAMRVAAQAARGEYLGAELWIDARSD